MSDTPFKYTLSSTPAVTNLKIAAGVDQLALAWGVSTTTNLQRVLVKWRRPGSTIWTTEMLVSGARSFTIPNLEAVQYEVEVLPLVNGTVAKGMGTPTKPAPLGGPPVVVSETATVEA